MLTGEAKTAVAKTAMMIEMKRMFAGGFGLIVKSRVWIDSCFDG